MFGLCLIVRQTAGPVQDLVVGRKTELQAGMGPPAYCVGLLTATAARNSAGPPGGCIAFGQNLSTVGWFAFRAFLVLSQTGFPGVMLWSRACCSEAHACMAGGSMPLSGIGALPGSRAYHNVIIT